MESLLEQLALCVEKGKVDKNAPFPPELKGQDGASEIAKKLLDDGTPAEDVLSKGLMLGMNRIGDKFSEGKAFIPNLLIAAKAMNAAMEHLKPFFESGEAKHKGTVVLGTVAGDLHDIGKNIVRMVLQGDGWKAVDLGVDVSAEKFLGAVNENPGCIVGLSALLTTTMVNMEKIVSSIKENHPDTQIYVGGAPLSQSFSDKIGADGYFHDPQQLAKHLNTKFS